MPIITPDLSDVGPLDPGPYPMEIAAVTPGTSKAGGEKLVVDFLVSIPSGKAKKRQSHVPTTGGGAFMFDQLLRACNLDDVANRLKDKSADHSFDTDLLVGQKLIGQFEADLYNGQPTDKLVAYLRA